MKESHLAVVIRNRVKKYGNRTAVKFKEENIYKELSWKELGTRIESVAQYLISQGINSFANIGIYSHNCPEWSITDFGILSTRGVVVPIFPTSTLDQLEYIVTETEMEILFVGDEIQLSNAVKALKSCSSLKKIITFFEHKSDHKQIIAFNDILNSAYNKKSKQILDQRLSEADKDDLATIIYTSGTTGEPKGVMLNHSHFLKLFEIHEIRLELGEDDVSLAFLPLSHVFERGWSYFVFYSGATNVYNANPKDIIHELPKIKPTVMCAVPRFFEKSYDIILKTAEKWNKPKRYIFNWAVKTGMQYIEYEKDSLTPPLALQLKHKLVNILVMKNFKKVFGGQIKYMPCAGAALNLDILKFFHALGLKINYGYGATETTATVSCMKKDKYDFVNTGSIMPDVQVKINEEDGQILVKGDTVFKGYYQKPEATAEVLKDGWYYTGDQGEIPEEGVLLMKERIKDIMKTSTGKYVSPQKIELHLSQCQQIEQLCVIGDNRRYLTALIVPCFIYLKSLHKQNNGQVENHDLVNNPIAIEEFQKKFDALQENLAPYEKVVKFKLLPEPFTIENNLMTNSLKVRRKQVNIKYKELIEEMYK
ncbi:AMP-dependent synthetase/ligase [Plebeiibacterium sediminum]|uniref:Long-chain fatty acid--CoA ligase n=1 Tax=Plebeiibacterium sediminum TaxID=2992112 RepID=A0AAE3SHE6_9BACT|nr:long-chain fatty acid--CoA ligase [Plebeiobacterium sediminum]MCW3789152.1 long-chain fatty acid--CoA ligase [Plebeiobacterium sediminum]